MRQERQTYDPRWHPDMAQFARRLAEPENAPAIRNTAEKLNDDWGGQRLSHLDFLRRLAAFREYERDPRCRNTIAPLDIDSQLVEIGEIMKYARRQTLAWLQPIHDELLCIARRTRWERQALLNVQPQLVDDFY